jgi:hypothetical protein
VLRFYCKKIELLGGRRRMDDDFITVNGVQIREIKETKDKPNISDKQFEVFYLDNVYVHKEVQFQFMCANVIGGRGRLKKLNGKQWMMVLMDTKDEFHKYREEYGQVASLVFEKIGIYLMENYKFKPECKVLIDSIDNFVTPPDKVKKKLWNKW